MCLKFLPLLLLLSLHAWQPCAQISSLSSFVAPAVTYRWRSENVQRYFNSTEFPIEYPLTEDLIQKGMPRLTPQELHRFLPLMSALTQKKTITVASLGGSFARGTQCCVGNAWPQRVVAWLQAAYPQVTFNHIRHMKGSTNSLHGASIVRELFNTTHVDLLLMGYAVNDEVRASVSVSVFVSVWVCVCV